MLTLDRDFLIENGRNTVRHINHEEYSYNDRLYKVGWDSNVPGWLVYASYSLHCPDCKGEGFFPDSTGAFSFNRHCGLCYREEGITSC